MTHNLNNEDYLKQLNILYVEDDDMIRERLSSFLLRRVANVYIASNGEEGLEMYRKFKPHLIVTDVQMPLLDGLGMAEEIRKENATIPIIVTTAFNMQDYFMKAIDIGIDKYVLKPIDKNILLNALQQCALMVKSQLENQLFLKIFETSLNAIVVTDLNGKIISANPAFKDITGYDPNEISQKNMHILKSGKHDKDFYEKLWNSLNSTGNWEGEIWNRNKNGELFIELLSINTVKDSLDNPVYYVGIFSDITERKAMELHIQHLAHHDLLTNLPNRTLLTDRIEQALLMAERTKHQLAIMFIDLDYFKKVNDELGHEVGDILLQQVAERLKLCLRSADTVSRYGGDEFVILLPEIATIEDATIIAQRIVKSIKEPFLINEHVANISSSIGISIYPNDSLQHDDLIRCADEAMYESKRNGKDTYRLFSEIK